MSICVVKNQVMEDKNESGIRNSFLIGMFLFVISILMPGTACFAEDICSHVDMAWISSHASVSPAAKIVLKQEQDSLCETILSIDGHLVPFYAGKDFIILGKLLKNMHSITQNTLDTVKASEKERERKAREIETLAVEKRKVFFENRFETLASLSSFSFNAAKGHKPLYVITDPDCFHCKRLLPKLETLAFEAGLELKMIIYPVLGAKSRDMAARTICNDYTFQKYKNIEPSKEVVSCEKANVLLKKTVSFLALADISFVPLVVAGDGSWVVEGSSIVKIRQNLGVDNSEGEKSSSDYCAPEEVDLQ